MPAIHAGQDVVVRRTMTRRSAGGRGDLRARLANRGGNGDRRVIFRQDAFASRNLKLGLGVPDLPKNAI